MKTILTIVASLAVAAGAYAQGNIKFANATATALRFDSNAAAAGGAALAGQKLAPGTSFIVGLYIGNSGATESGLTLFKTTSISTTATATTSGAAGLFNGGNPLAVTGFNGVDIQFMVKAWSTGFASYEAANANPTPTTYAGKSALGTYALKTGASPVTDIMAAAPSGGTVAPFTVALVPEPASASIIGLGLASLMIFRRRK